MGPGRARRRRRSAKACRVLLGHFPEGDRLTVFLSAGIGSVAGGSDVGATSVILRRMAPNISSGFADILEGRVRRRSAEVALVSARSRGTQGGGRESLQGGQARERAYCVFLTRIAHCVLRIAAIFTFSLSLIPHCVLRIGYVLPFGPPSLTLIAYCVLRLRIAYCPAHFDPHCVLRFAFCVLACPL